MFYSGPLIFHAPFNRLSYFIAFTENALLKTLDHIGCGDYGLPYKETTLAATFQNWHDGMRVNAIYFPILQTEKCSAENISHVVHEAIHVVEDVLHRMGEKSASEEFRAYLTGEISRNLISEFLLYIGVHAGD